MIQEIPSTRILFQAESQDHKPSLNLIIHQIKKKNILFINDSKATSFKATQSALLSQKNIYWILGGIPKKGDKIITSGGIIG